MKEAATMNTRAIDTAPKPLFGFKQWLKCLRTWKARKVNRYALRHDFHGASPGWMARMERDVGLEPGTLQAEMNKPFWVK